MSGLTTGRIVHFVDPETGHHDAAIVAFVDDAETGRIRVRDFSFLGCPLLEAEYSADAKLGTWHWIERD